MTLEHLRNTETGNLRRRSVFRKYKIRRRITEGVLTLIIFAIIVFAAPGLLKGGLRSLTGNVVVESEESLQVEIQEVFRSEFFNTVGNNARFCLQIKESGDFGENFYAFKIRKISGVFDVRPSEVFCEGRNDEDFIFNFVSYDDFLEFKERIGIDYFLEGDAVKRFEVWPSKYMEADGIFLPVDGFEEKYGDFVRENIPRSIRDRWGLKCCDGSILEMPSGELFGFIKGLAIEYWWLLATIGLMLVLGFGAFVLLSSKEPDKGDTGNPELLGYIQQARDAGYKDNVIRQSLLETGWNEKAVDTEFERLRKKDLTFLGDRFRKLH